MGSEVVLGFNLGLETIFPLYRNLKFPDLFECVMLPLFQRDCKGLSSYPLRNNLLIYYSLNNGFPFSGTLGVLGEGDSPNQREIISNLVGCRVIIPRGILIRLIYPLLGNGK